MTTVTKMRLSKETFNILKNFSAINSNILIKPGNRIKTVSSGKNIFAEANVQEDFDTEVGIWDLNKFLGVISMFNNPDLEFHEKYVEISNGRSSVKYYYSEPTLLTVPPKDVKMPDVMFSFDLDEKDLNEILKASSILQVSNLNIVAKDGEIKIVVSDEKDDTSNSFSVTVNEDYSGPDYIGSLDVSDIKFLPGSYKVELSKGIVSRFKHSAQDLSYYIAIKRG
jgi:hypothetical protein